jgi:hypothetical protein
MNHFKGTHHQTLCCVGDFTDRWTVKADVGRPQIIQGLDVLSALVKPNVPRFVTKYDFAPNVAIALHIL